jgi:hypothetical protein
LSSEAEIFSGAAKPPELTGLASSEFLGDLAHAVLPSVFVLYAGYRYNWDEQMVGLTLAARNGGKANVEARPKRSDWNRQRLQIAKNKLQTGCDEISWPEPPPTVGDDYFKLGAAPSTHALSARHLLASCALGGLHPPKLDRILVMVPLYVPAGPLFV